MKRLKCLPLIILTLLLVGSVFTACSKMNEDHTSLLKDGNIYRVTYDADGGAFGKARQVHLYYDKADVKAADPDDSKKGFAPTKDEQFVRSWYYKEYKSTASGVEVEKVIWSFENDKVTKDMMTEIVDKKSGITYYDFVLYPEWEYYLYVDYYISYVETDTTTYINTRSDVVEFDYKKQEEILAYQGKLLTHQSGTAVPEEYNEFIHADIKSAAEIKPMYYADAELTQRITFPLDSSVEVAQAGEDKNRPLMPQPEKGKNHTKVYVKFFNESFKILATPADLSVIENSNYYLWRNINFLEKNKEGNLARKSIIAAESYEGKAFLGNGNTISNLSVVSRRAANSTTNLGMFGTIINSEIRDITFENCTFYFNMTGNMTEVNCGLLAGSLSGEKSKVLGVTMSDCHGYVRNNNTEAVYNPKYSVTNKFLYNTSKDIPASSIQTVTDNTTINYCNVYLQAVDTVEQSGFTVWHSGDITNKDLLLQFGNFNQELKQYNGTDTDRPKDYNIGVRLCMTEINGVNVTIFGEEMTSEQKSSFKKDATTGLYVYTMYVAEEIKAGKIVVEWNDEIKDEYKYLVTGGSGDIIAARNLGSDTVTVEYDDGTHTLTYGTNAKIDYYSSTATGEQGLKDRPTGYAVPLRLRLFAKVADKDIIDSTAVFKDIKITIDGTVYDIKDVGMATQSGTAHYFEFWQPVSPDNRDRSVVVRFYDRYEVEFLIKAGKGVSFAAAPEANTLRAFAGGADTVTYNLADTSAYATIDKTKLTVC